jgi:hypothetical protein
VKATQETTTAMVSAAVERGINYFDVLFSNPDYRDHFGQAFAGLRDRVIITGHLPVTDPVSACQQSFEDHLRRLRIDAVDLLFVSCCDGEPRYRQVMGPGGHYELAAELARQGKARHIAFSSHTVPVALQAVRSGQFEVLMFPINPAFDTLPGELGTDDLGKLWDGANQRQPDPSQNGLLPARKELYHECASRNIGLVAMKPFAAGWLFKPELDTGFTPLNLLHYALSQPGVSCVVPGMANLEQLDLDVSYFTASEAAKDYSAALAGSRWNYMGACMYCNHCQPCTAGIDISEVNKLLHLAKSGHVDAARQAYAQLSVKASSCQECRECMQRCPFGVEVIEQMQAAVALLER